MLVLGSKPGSSETPLNCSAISGPHLSDVASHLLQFLNPDFSISPSIFGFSSPESPMPFSHHQLLPDPILPALLSLPALTTSAYPYPASHLSLLVWPCPYQHLIVSRGTEAFLDSLTLCLSCLFTVPVLLPLPSLPWLICFRAKREALLWLCSLKHEGTGGTLKKSYDYDLIWSARASFLLVWWVLLFYTFRAISY